MFEKMWIFKFKQMIRLKLSTFSVLEYGREVG